MKIKKGEYNIQETQEKSKENSDKKREYENLATINDPQNIPKAKKTENWPIWICAIKKDCIAPLWQSF